MTIDYQVDIETELTATQLLSRFPTLEVTQSKFAATGTTEFECLLPNDLVVYVRPETQSVSGPYSPRFGITTNIAVYFYPRDERRAEDAIDVVDLIAKLAGDTESRGYATLIEPIEFFWDRKTAAVSDTALASSEVAERFQRNGLSTAIQKFDIDIGYPVAD